MKDYIYLIKQWQNQDLHFHVLKHSSLNVFNQQNELKICHREARLVTLRIRFYWMATSKCFKTCSMGQGELRKEYQSIFWIYNSHMSLMFDWFE